MKKLLFLFSIFFILLSMVSGEALITVTEPALNDVWQPGIQHDIVWTKSGQQHLKVKIRLFDSTASNKLLEIVNDTPNDGLFKWTVPAGYNTGVYVIMVKTKDDLVWDISEQFQIGTLPPVEGPEIDVTDPALNKTWYVGKYSDIKWTKKGTMAGTVKITLHSQPETPPLRAISPGAPNNGTFNWKIPEDQAEGSYVILVRTSDNQVEDYSKQFNIKKSKFEIKPDYFPMIGKIVIVKPSIPSFWDAGTTQQIKWKNKFTKGKGVWIDLYNFSGSQFIKRIATLLPIIVKPIGKGKTKPPETSTYNWFIPSGTAPGKYKIKITRADSLTSGMSDMFTIRIKTAVKTYTIEGSFGNYCRRTYWAKGGQASLAQMMSQVGDCVAVGGMSKGFAGFSNHLYGNKVLYYGDIWRTHAFFDLSQFIGKGIILKAKLKIWKSYYPPGANGEVRVYQLLNPIVDAFNISGELVENPTVNMTSIAQSWMGFPGENYGIMLTGPDESFQHNQVQCKIFLNSIKLEIEFLEKK